MKKSKANIILKPDYLEYSTCGLAFGVAPSKNGVDGRLDILIDRETARLQKATAEDSGSMDFYARMIREEENQIIAEGVRAGRDLSSPERIEMFLAENKTGLLEAHYAMRDSLCETISDELLNLLTSLRALTRPVIYDRLQKAAFLGAEKRVWLELTLLGVHYFTKPEEFALLQKNAVDSFTPQPQGVHLICAGLEKNALNSSFYYPVGKRAQTISIH
jgi:hypothetical protein